MAVNDNQTQYMLRHCLSIQTDQIHHHSCQKTCILYQFYLAGHSHLPHLITLVKFKVLFTTLLSIKVGQAVLRNVWKKE